MGTIYNMDLTEKLVQCVRWVDRRSIMRNLVNVRGEMVVWLSEDRGDIEDVSVCTEWGGWFSAGVSRRAADTVELWSEGCWAGLADWDGEALESPVAWPPEVYEVIEKALAVGG